MEHKIYENGRNEFKKAYILTENLLLIAQFLLGFIGMLEFKISCIPYISIAYIFFALIMLGFVLRKHLCTHCFYYGKWCHCGWGKLSSLMYKKDSGNIIIGSKTIGPTWGILMTLPILIMMLAIVLNKVSFSNISLVFISYIILVIINGAIHVCDCKKCKMRFICPGSAAKNKISNQ
jgi:hypothetical protein